MREDLSKTYDAWSKTYDTDPNIMLEAERTAIDSILSQIEFSRVLDAGTGTGRHAIELARGGASVWAFDANEQMLSVARQKAEGLDIKFKSGSLPLLPWTDLRFDLVLCTMVLAHVEELDTSIVQLSHVLSATGNLVISDLHPALQAEGGPDYREVIAGEPRAFPQFRRNTNEYHNAFKAAGLTVRMESTVPVKIPGRGELPGLSVFHCSRA